MAMLYFGQFLLGRGVLTSQQLMTVVDHQERHNLRLGELAMKQRLLSEDQVARVTGLQRVKDVQFGQAAVELGLLRSEQVDELLEQQRATRMYFGDVVVHLGFAQRERIERELDAFRRDQQRFEVARMVIPQEVPAEAMAADLFNLTQRMIQRLWGMRCKLGAPQIVRGRLQLLDHSVQVRITGGASTRFLLAADGSVLMQALEHVLGDEDPTAEECQDLLGEFANIVSGNVVTAITQDGLSATIEPPTAIEPEFTLAGERALVVHIATPVGQVRVAVTF